ncbi:MAG: ribbon-helix-helix protein, CopG family [Acidobacteria bacterium]|nr:ribbon-helix-helix protein, CopG family [Acidobacteriota bacterium]
MRTTISLDDRLAKQVRREAAATGVSVSACIASILDDALKSRAAVESPKPFRLIAVGGSGSPPGIDLDRPRVIEIADDEAHFGHRRS